nr:tetratricopeptide repeat protein [bacterium]
MNKRTTALVPFMQDAQQLHRRGVRHLEDGNIAQAMGYLTRAWEQQPENAEFVLDYAQALHVAELYDLSTRALLMLDYYGRRQVPEAYFGLACNFFKTNRADLAAQYLKEYIDCDETGPYAAEAYDMLEHIEEVDGEEAAQGEGVLPAADVWARDGLLYLAQGRHQEAAPYLSQAALAGTTLMPRHNLAQALFASGQEEEAIHISQRMAHENPGDVLARCNLALFYAKRGEQGPLNRWLEEVERAAQNGDEAAKGMGAAVLGQMGRYEQAWQLMKSSGVLNGFETQALHMAAALAYNAGRRAEAARIWQRMCRAFPMDIQAPYFRALALEPAREDDEKLALEYRFPHEKAVTEMITLLARIEGEGAAEAWARDITFRRTVRWGLEWGTGSVKGRILSFLEKCADGHAIHLMREMLLWEDGEPAVRQQAVEALMRLTRGPFLACMGGEWVELRPKRQPATGPAVDRYHAALELARRTARREMGMAGEAQVDTVYHALMRHIGWPLPRLDIIEDLAAGIYCAAALSLGEIRQARRHFDGQTAQAAYWASMACRASKGEE